MIQFARCPEEIRRLRQTGRRIDAEQLLRMMRKPRPMNSTITIWRGRCSIFGGPNDQGMIHDTGLTLYEPLEADRAEPLFHPGAHDVPTWKRLKIESYYIALPFIGFATGAFRRQLQAADFRVSNPKTGKFAVGRIVDRGPAFSTNRLVDLSPGMATEIGIETDGIVDVQLLSQVEGFALDPRASFDLA